jgi:Ras GTPase-activating-like protein IQGAP2/3
LPRSALILASSINSKKRIVLPWSMQGVHQRKLEKSGKHYKFGSYKYTAQTLYDRGILLSIDQYSPKQFDKISLTVSSDDIGVFEITAAYMGVPVTTVELKLEDLLESQFVRLLVASSHRDRSQC